MLAMMRGLPAFDFACVIVIVLRSQELLFAVVSHAAMLLHLLVLVLYLIRLPFDLVLQMP